MGRSRGYLSCYFYFMYCQNKKEVILQLLNHCLIVYIKGETMAIDKKENAVCNITIIHKDILKKGNCSVPH